MMRVEAPHRPGDFVTGADHGAVEVDRQSAKLQLLDLFIEQLAVDPRQRAQRALSKLLEPVDYRTVAGHAGETAEAREQGILGQVTQVLEPPRADHQQPDHQQDQVSAAVIAACMLTQRSSNPRLQLDEVKVAAQQFQSAVGSELLVTELDWKLLLDRLPQPPFLQPHLWGLRVVPSGVAAALQTTRLSPLFFDQIVESTRFNFGLRLCYACDYAY